jgi:imidazole glycerol-phosphate synthase subunit HisH
MFGQGLKIGNKEERKEYTFHKGRFMKKTVIIGGCGANIASVVAALKRIGTDAVVSTDAKEIFSASHVILPGVGSAGSAMQRLKELGLVDVIKKIESPLLGICLGMQLLFESSDEEGASCLGLLPGKVKKFPEGSGLTIPHMGWNQLHFAKQALLFSGVEEQSNVFFVHSYFVPMCEYTIAEADYGQRFSAAVNRDNVFGCQFHPERSSKAGSQILQNFLRL